jgi:hypothetical protein
MGINIGALTDGRPEPDAIPTSSIRPIRRPGVKDLTDALSMNLLRGGQCPQKACVDMGVIRLEFVNVSELRPA